SGKNCACKSSSALAFESGPKRRSKRRGKQSRFIGATCHREALWRQWQRAPADPAGGEDRISDSWCDANDWRLTRPGRRQIGAVEQDDVDRRYIGEARHAIG